MPVAGKHSGSPLKSFQFVPVTLREPEPVWNALPFSSGTVFFLIRRGVLEKRKQAVLSSSSHPQGPPISSLVLQWPHV